VAVTFLKYLEEVAQVRAAFPHWREGQTYFNVLCERRPDISEHVRSTQLDPFHRDAIVPAFLQFVESAWVKGVQT